MTLAEAQHLVARFQGFDNWQALTAFALSVPPKKTTTVAKSIRLYSSADSEHREADFTSRDWDEVLALLAPLEEITFDSCAGLSNAGIAALARLPRLRELRVESMPNVTREVTSAFGSGVRVRYGT